MAPFPLCSKAAPLRPLSSGTDQGESSWKYAAAEVKSLTHWHVLSGGAGMLGGGGDEGNINNEYWCQITNTANTFPSYLPCLSQGLDAVQMYKA